MKTSALNELFHAHDVQRYGQLTIQQLANMFNDLRIGGISLSQVAASMEYICGNSDSLVLEELKSVLEEMDRRYFLVQDLQWEFALLDNEHRGAISVDKARFLFQAVHGNMFSDSCWRKFLRQRVLSDAPVTFCEIEVDLCSRPTFDHWDLLETKAPSLPNHAKEHGTKKDRLHKKQDRRMDEEQRRKREEIRFKEEEIKKQEQKKKRKEMFEGQKNQMIEQLIENGAQHTDDLTIADAEKGEMQRPKAEKTAQELKEVERIEREIKLKEEEQQKQKEINQKVEDEEKERIKKKALKDARKKERAAAHQEVYDKLEHAMETKNESLLEPAIKQYKDQVRKRDHDELLSQAERLLEMLKCSQVLKDAMTKRLISDLEKAVEKARKCGFDQSEQALAKEVVAADDLLLRLRRLERLRSGVLELKQSTIAEIRSYQKPMQIIHSIMIATYLLVGVPESQTKKWLNVQTLLGKTGKEGLKRRIAQCNVINIQVPTAKRACDVIGDVDLEAIRDVSAGAATFFVWAEGMIEEVLANKEV